MSASHRSVAVSSLALLVAGGFAASACSDRSQATLDAGPASASIPAQIPPAPTPAPLDAGAPAVSASSPTYEDETSTRPMELLKFQFSSGIEARQPKGKMVMASPGDRVYAFLTLRNRSGRKRSVHLEFRVNGEKRTEMDLDISESWSYRTWGYNTIGPNDKPGKLTLSVTDDAGQPVLDETLPIVKKPGK